jgi:rhodanese-related sulfurtransferase
MNRMVRQLSVQELASKRQAGEALYLVDVRQPWEHEMAALPESVLIPLPELPTRLDELAPPRGALVVVYCHHGIRSLSGAAILEQHGVSPVASLAGGIDAWSRLVDPQVPRYR